MIRRALCAGLGLFVCFAAAPLAAQAAGPGPPEEAPLRLRLGGVVDTLVTALYWHDTVYLPIGELFADLGVSRSLEPGPRVTGFFIDRTARYELDFSHRVARVRGREIPLAPGTFIARDLDVYVIPALLDSIFEMRTTVDLRTLELRVDADETFPVVAAALRKREKPQPALPAVLRPPAPLWYGRDEHALQLGVLDYFATVTSGASGPASSVELSGGAEVLGGGLQASLSTATGAASRLSTVQWQRVFHDGAPITQLDLGQLSGGVLRPRQFIGASISNEPVELRTGFGSHVVEGRTQPGWEVELRQNGQVVERTEADALGRYRFDVPLLYGTTEFTIHHFGPTGEHEVEARRIQVPFNFVQRGRIEYELQAGESTEGAAYAHGELAVGATDWLTARGGVEYARDSSRSAPVPYGAIDARLFEDYVVHAESAPGGLSRVRVHASLPSSLEWGVGWSVDARAVTNDSSDVSVWDAHASVPVRIPGAPSTLRLSATRQRRGAGVATGTINAEATTRLGRWRPSLLYEQSGPYGSGQPGRLRQEGIGAGTTYRLRGPFSTSTYLRGSAEYRLDRGAWSEWELTAIEPVRRLGQLQLTLRHQPETGSVVELNFRIERANVRAATVVRSGASSSVSQSVTGAVGWDAVSERPVFSARGMAGRSGAIFRFFADADGDGHYDPGEALVPGANVRFRQAIATRRISDGLTRAGELFPYTRYSVTIDASSVANPTLVPRADSFSFVTDPNAYKIVDVPFYISGMLEGSVVRAGPGGEEPIAGLNVRLRCVDCTYSATVCTFNDGAIYATGLPPGTYEISIDPEQLRLLQAHAEPDRLVVRVKAGPVGDDVSGVDFELVPDSPAQPPAPAPAP